MIPELLQATFHKPFELELAHRVPSHPSSTTVRPRPFVAKVLHYLQVLQILQMAKQKRSIQLHGHKIAFYPDLCKKTVERRKELLACRPVLQQLQARYGLFYPAKMRVTLDNTTHTFDSAAALQTFLQDFAHIEIGR